MTASLLESDEDDLASATELAAHAGNTVWPGVAVPSDAFREHVRTTGARPADLSRNGSDLYLACAGARGDALALRIFEQRLLPPLAAPIRRLGVPSASAEDALQNVAVSLLAGPRPGILGYSARSPLPAWLRVVAMRTAIDLLRQVKTPGFGDSLLHDLADDGDDPELRATKLRHTSEVQRALQDCLEGLPRRSKTILRMFYVDGLNIDAIGAVYHVHRATVARWMISIRAEVTADLRARLGMASKATASDFRSLVLALRDEIQVSLRRVLKTRNTE
jgi:RNA polymerase sigma-70 factor (ECF subfamily)